MGTAFLHDPDGRPQRFGTIPLIRTEGNVYHHQSSLYPPYDGSGMVDHLIQRDGEGGFMTGHDIGRRISYQDDIYAGCIYNPGHRIIISRQHGDLFSTVFHFLQDMGSDSFDIGGWVDRHSG